MIIKNVLVTIVVVIRKIRRRVGLPVADISKSTRPFVVSVREAEALLAGPPKEIPRE
jgi:hypothetical protein